MNTDFDIVQKIKSIESRLQVLETQRMITNLNIDTLTADRITAGNLRTAYYSSIADDTVVSFVPDTTLGFIMMNGRNNNYKEYLIAIYRIQATSFVTSVVASANVNTTTGVLTGTTGTDGKITVSVDATQGKIYIENRLGITISVGYVLLSQ